MTKGPKGNLVKDSNQETTTFFQFDLYKALEIKFDKVKVHISLKDRDKAKVKSREQ